MLVPGKSAPAIACLGRPPIVTTPQTDAGSNAAAGASGAMDAASIKQWLWAFAEQTPEHAILLLDLRFTVLWANPGAGRIFGIPPMQMTGQPMHRFFTPEDIGLGIPEHEIAVAISEGSSEDDRWMARGDGSPFWASGRTVALSDAHGAVTGLLKILRNQTEMKMRMNTFRNRLMALEEIENARTIALATLSHELRNPLSALNMAATLIGRMVDDARLQHPVSILQRNVGYVTRMVDDLEQATRIRVGKLALAVEPLWLHEELDAAIQTALARAGNPAREVQLLLPPGQLISFEADRLRVQQVFVNLIGNAIKFTAQGGSIWIKGTTESRHVVVRIEDDGEGIAPDMLETIFSMFTQVHLPGEQAEQAGLGIGLALVKRIVELHGGSVQANSNGIGLGSQFTVRLPLRQPRHPAAAA
ncbi:MAG: domain S-box-containing protein [Xanthomonadaceae bacterium]|nr:domain S-box-containing protein [Xanthomonadaceae bacterium]